MDDLKAKIAGLSAEEQCKLLDERWSFDEKLQRKDGECDVVSGMKLRFADPRSRAENGPLERTITDKILRWLRAQDGCWCFKVAGSGGQMRGVPDIVGCFNGRFFALEVKRPKGGRLSVIQKHVIGLIAGAGGIVGVVRSVEDVQRLLLGGEHEQE